MKEKGWRFWSPEGLRLLRKLVDEEKLPIREIASYFPDRTYDAVEKQIRKMKRKRATLLQMDPIVITLQVLQQNKYPLTLTELQARFIRLGAPTSRDQIKDYIKALRHEGYDIKEITRGQESLFVLVRENPPAKPHYRPLADLEFPILCSADYHIGSCHFSPLAMKQLIRDTEEYSVKDLLAVGDILQGRGVHRVELIDLEEPDIQYQIDETVKWLSKFNCRIHMVLGSHEEKIKGSTHVGLDCLKLVSQRIEGASYYGAVAYFTIKKKFDLLMTHGSGGPSYARSYKAEKLWDALYEKPNFYVLAHLHVLDVISKGQGHYIIQSGTLQRENSYLIWKGFTPQIGWIILLDFNGDKLEFLIREPRVP